MFQLLPQIVQLTENEKNSEYQRLVGRLEQTIVQNALHRISTDIRCLQGYQSIHTLNQEQKEKLFSLLITYILSKYVYGTKHIFQTPFGPKKLKQFLTGFSKKISNNISIKWEDLRQIYDDINQNGLQATFDNTDQQVRRGQQCFSEFLALFRHIIPANAYPQLLNCQLQGEIVNPRLFRIAKSESISTYAKSFELIMDLKRIPVMQRQIDPQLVPQLIIQRPDLPVDGYIDFILEETYNQFISCLLSNQQQGMLIPLFGPKITEIVRPLVYLIAPSTNQARIKVWDTIERMFLVISDLLHPNNVGQSDFVFSFFYCFVKAFVERVESQNQSADKNQESENVFENNVFVKDDQQFVQDDEVNDNEDEEEEEEEDSEKEKLFDKKEYEIDSDCIERFIQIVKPYLKYLIYQRDKYRIPVGGIIRSLCKLRPKEITPYILDNIQLALERDDLKPLLILHIVEKIFKQSIQHDQYPQIIKYIPFIMRQTTNFILDHGEQIWRFYDILFQYIPIYEIKDLEQQYPNANLQQDMLIEDIDFYQVTQEFSDLSLEAFRKYICTFEYNDQKHHNSQRTSDIIFSTRNKFFNFVSQCSKSNFKEVVNIVCNYLDDKIINKLNDNLILLLHAIVLRDPLVLKDVLTVISNQLIRTVKDHPEFNISNIVTIQNYLTIVYEIVQFSGKSNKQFYKELKVLIDLSFKHEEVKVQQAGQAILYYLLLSQAAMHVADFSFSNSTQLQLDWLRLKEKGKSEKYVPHWQEKNDQEFIKQIMDDYYYPALKDIQEILTSKNEQKSLQQYIEQDFLTKFEQQYLLDQKQPQNQLDLKVRKNLARNLEIVYSFYKPLLFRIKQNDEKPFEAFQNFQEKYCFPILDNMFLEAKNLCMDFLQLYINYGLSLDQRIISAYNNLIKMLLSDSSDKLPRLSKWLQAKIRSPDPNKLKFHNRYQACMFFTFILNARIDYLYFHQLIHTCRKDLYLISIPLMFDQNDFANKSNWHWFASRLELLDKNDEIYSFLKNFYEKICSILKGKLFSQQYIDNLSDSEKQKLSLFQNHFLKGFTNVVTSVSTVNPGLFLDSYQILDSTYQSLIDRVYKSEFNLDVLTLIQKVSLACIDADETDGYQKNNILIIKNQEVQIYIDAIFTQRESFWNDNKQKWNSIQQNLNQQLETIVNQWLEIPIDASNSRTLITYGCALFMIRSEQLPQLNDKVIEKAFNCCNSSEFNIRSFGRLLLYRLMQISVFKNKEYRYINRTEEDFTKDKITFQQYQEYRFLLNEDQQFYKLNDFHRKGKLFTYNQLKYAHINREEVRKQFTVLEKIDPEQWKQFVNLMVIDLSVFDQQQQSQQMNPLLDKLNYSNFFNDIDNQQSDTFFYNTFMQNHPKISSLYKKVQFMKYLFVITDYKFFSITKDLIDSTSLDQQLFQRLYLSGLLQAVHSSWPCQIKTELIDFSIDQLNKVILDQSRDQFRNLNYYIYAALSKTDLRKQNLMLSAVLQKIKQEKENNNRQSRWITLFYIMIESKRFQSLPNVEDILSLEVDFSKPKAASTFIPLILDQQNKLPHNIELLSNLGLLEQFNKNTKPLVQLKYFVLENPTLFNYGLDVLVTQFLNQSSNAKLNIIENLSEISKTKKIQFNLVLLQKIQPITEYLLTVNEENNSQQLTQGLVIFQNLKNKESTQYLLDLVFQLLKTSQNVVKIRQLNFVKSITKDVLSIDRARILSEVSQYLLDENKTVKESCLEVVTQLIQQMTFNEINQQLEIFTKQATTKDTEIVGKQVLMAMVMSHPRYIQPWINQVLKVILEKHSKLQQQQKSFAANYLKLYRANQLMEIEENQISIEYIEKMSELSNPYNYFA